MRVSAGVCGGVALALSVLASGGARAEFCDDPSAVCRAKLPAECVNKYGAGSVAAATDDAGCGAAFDAYRGCLEEAARTCGDTRVQADRADEPDRDRQAKAAWEAVKGSQDPVELDFVAKRYPGTFWGDLAAKRATDLRNDATGGHGAAVSSAAAAPEVAPQVEMAMAAQRALTEKCFYRGAIDGKWDFGPRAALKTFQKRRGMPADGALDQDMLSILQSSSITNCKDGEKGPSKGLAMAAQRALAARCFYYGAINGDWDAASHRAWRAWQIRSGDKAGSVTAGTVAKIRFSKATNCVGEK